METANELEDTLPIALVHFDQLPNSAYVRMPVLLGLLSVSQATVWRLVKSGRIPKPTKLATRTSAWNVGDLRSALRLYLMS